MSDTIEKAPVAWHTKKTDETMRELDSSSSGLSAHEAGQRLEQSGPNMLKEGARRSPLMMIVDQFKDHFPFLGVVLSSSSPQISRAFFFSTKRAAVSARALSLRLSSFSRARIRLESASRLRAPALEKPP